MRHLKSLSTRTLAGLLGLLSSLSTLQAAPFAFVSVSSPGNRAVRVIDMSNLTVERSLTNVGDEPGRMVATHDRKTIYLSSWRSSGSGLSAAGQIYRIDTAFRRVTAVANVGARQNRTVALSPDEQRVYTWKQVTEDGVTRLDLAVLDATTLTELASTTLPTDMCLATAYDILVHPDGRILLSGCQDGLRIADPDTLALTLVGPMPSGNPRLLGFTPQGDAVLTPAIGSVSAFGITGIAAMDLQTGSITAVGWQLSGSSFPGFPTGSAAFRMTRVQRSTDLPDNPLFVFSYFTANGNSPVAYATADDLALSPPRLTGLVDLGPMSSFGADPDGEQGIGGRLGALRRVSIAASEPVLSTDGVNLALSGVDTLTDIVITDQPYAFVFADGMEGN